MPYGEPIVWNGGKCSEYAWQANQLVGAPDFYPGYGDARQGWDLSSENNGAEFIEVKIEVPVYITGFELYETYKPGALAVLSSTPSYDDDNTVACCVDVVPANLEALCSTLPTCSKTTRWYPLWSGAPGSTGEEATLFAPPVCPYAFKTGVLRLDLDTAAAPGWNNFDAVKVLGHLDPPPGLILPDATAPGAENKVTYVGLPGVFGTDTFAYEVTDCLEYGPPATVSVELQQPAAPFRSVPYLAIPLVQASSGASTVRATVRLDVPPEPGTFSLYELLRGTGDVSVTLSGLEGLSSLRFGAGSPAWTTAGAHGTIGESAWGSGVGVEAEGLGRAEIWLSSAAASLTYIIHVHVSPPNPCAAGTILALDERGQQTCTACEPGTFEFSNRICVAVDSRHYIPITGATAQDVSRYPCPPRTQVSDIFVETVDGVDEVRVQLRTGGANESDCRCAAGTYEVRYDGGRPGAGILAAGSDSASNASAAVCEECPDGALCLGASLQPIARAGYTVQEPHKARAYTMHLLSGALCGLSADSEHLVWHRYGLLANATGTSFYPCVGVGRCPGPRCDCIGGSHSQNGTTLVQCGDGYIEGSPMCALCTPGYAKTMGECRFCDGESDLFFWASLVVVLAWFPLVGWACEKWESLEITIGFVQFLGLYANFQTEWRPELQDLFRYCSFFNLDVDMMHLACWNRLRWQTLWLLQVCLPLLYPLVCLVRIAISYALLQLTANRLPPSGLLLRWGWRPRRLFTWASLRDSYVPSFMLYMHMYYITGISKTIEILWCEGDPEKGELYLRANPAIRCWEGEHLILVAVDMLAIIVYFVISPSSYFYVLGHLYPRLGRNHPRLFANFGFIYSRFEERMYYWEVVEMVRKIGLVLVMVLISNPQYQTFCAFACVGFVMLMHFYNRPYIKLVYDVYDMVSSAVQVLILVLGLLVNARKVEEDEKRAAGVDFIESSVLETTAELALCIVLVLCLYTFEYDIRGFWLERRAKRLRDSRDIALPNFFHIGGSLVSWLRRAPDEHIFDLRSLEKRMVRAVKHYSSQGAGAKRRAAYESLLAIHPHLLDWVLATATYGHIRCMTTRRAHYPCTRCAAGPVHHVWHR